MRDYGRVGPGVDVDVWWGRPTEGLLSGLDLLDEAERARRAALRQPADQARFTLAANLLRMAASRVLGVPPEQLQVDRTCPDCGRPHGKPRLTGQPVELSVSHSGDRVAVAVTTAGPVGVDVEQVGSVDFANLAGHVLAPGETATSASDFYVYWTRKESVLKATGDGLRVAMTDIEVSPPNAAPALLRYADRAGLTATMADLSPGAGYHAAVTVLGSLARVREHDAAELLAG